MADMILCDHLEKLWNQIAQQHLLYLISVESVGKLDQREKLENYIKEYLCLAPHNRKFTFPQTAEVLHKSASKKETFNGYKAANAWKAIGKYADNLVVQPWRKEFKDLKLYCGFYKHEVEENLSDAELMFEAMGYCHMGNSTMAIADILDPDRITSVSKDAILAYVECQIMKQIWEQLSPYYNFSWLEILEFRENHTGTPDQAVRVLSGGTKRRQRQYEEEMYRRAQYQAAENHSRTDYDYVSNTSYYNYIHYPGQSYSYPVQSRYSLPIQHVVSPGSVYPPPLHAAYIPQAIKPQALYPPNGYHIYSHYPPQDTYPSYPTVHPQQSAVPTGQLIELDSTPAQNNERSQRYAEENLSPKWQDLDKNDFPSGKAKDDGAGSWESWHYVYRTLESQGYKKNLQRGEKATGSESKAQGEVVDKMRKMNITKAETEDESRSRGGSRRETTSEIKSHEQNAKRVASPLRNQKKEDSESEKKTSRALPVDEDDVEKWECISCTYLNSKEKQICEMCYKSKERGDEARPQPSGGQECTNCTLVNERGLNFCVACAEPLKDSPTYI